MNKKFLSAILFGALMVTSTGTFVSCKDYDDDIKELQDQINQQKTDLSSKVTAVEASITSLQTAQSGLDKKIAETKDAAEKAALEAQKAAIATAQAELEAAKKDIATAMADLQGDVDANAAEIKRVNDAIEAQIATVSGRIKALEAFQVTTDETLKALAEADGILSSTVAALDVEVKANAEAIGKNKAAIEAQIAALEAYQESNGADIASIKAELAKHQEVLDKLNAFDVQATMDAIAKLEADYAALSTKVSEINDRLEMLSAAINKGITHVALETSPLSESFGFNLLSAEAVRTWVFGEDLSNEISFVKGERTAFVKKFLIRVSPADAVVTVNNIELINSKGESLAGIVNVAEIKPFTGLLTRGISETGLWEVSLSTPADLTTKAFTEAVTTPAKDLVRFAVNVNTTLDAEKNEFSRKVVSAYGITIDPADRKPVAELDFTVDEVSVANIHNRAKLSEEDIFGTETPAEYVWKDGKVAAEPTIDNQVEGDDRQDKAIHQAVAGKAITIELGENVVDGATAFYIELDKKRAVSSDDSELSAWNILEKEGKIEGINEVYNIDTTNGVATIKIAEGVNDVLGFRVFAVNSDGSLVDPDGRAFYVRVGKDATAWSAIATTVMPTLKDAVPTAAKSAAVAVSTTKLVGAEELEWTTDGITGVTGNIFDVTFYKADGKTEVFTTSTSDLEGIKFEEVAKAIVTPKTVDAWKKYEDGKEYTGTLKIKNVKGQTIATLKVSMTKELPKVAPKGFSISSTQYNAATKVLNCYLTPSAWAVSTATNGTIDTDNLFDFGTGTTAGDYVIEFAKSTGVDNADALEVTGGEDLTISAVALIDGKTAHATTVEYDYGVISSEANATAHKVKVAEFSTIYKTIFDNDAMAWTWANREQMGSKWADKDAKGNYLYNTPSTKLTFGVDYTMEEAWETTNDYVDITIEEAIFGKSGVFKDYSSLLSAPYQSALQIESATLKGENGKEYFTVTVAQNKMTTFVANLTDANDNPKSTVKCTLEIKCKDMYGKDRIIKLPMTVEPKI